MSLMYMGTQDCKQQQDLKGIRKHGDRESCSYPPKIPKIHVTVSKPLMRHTYPGTAIPLQH